MIKSTIALIYKKIKKLFLVECEKGVLNVHEAFKAKTTNKKYINSQIK